MGHRYRQMDIRTASPETLISKLLEKAVRCTQAARGPERDPALRGQALGRALDIVSELRNSLDFEAGGEIARNLDLLYEFVADRLIAASLSSQDAPLDESLKVLETLREGWNEMLASGAAVRKAS